MHLKLITLILILLPFIFTQYQDITNRVDNCNQCDEDIQTCLYCQYSMELISWGCFAKSEANWYCCGCNLTTTGTCIACSSQSLCTPNNTCLTPAIPAGYIVIAIVIGVAVLSGIITIVVCCACKDQCGCSMISMTPGGVGGGGNPTNDYGGDNGPTVNYGGGVDTGSTPMVDYPQPVFVDSTPPPVVDYTPPPVVDYTPPPTVDFGGGGFEHHHHDFGGGGGGDFGGGGGGDFGHHHHGGE